MPGDVYQLIVEAPFDVEVEVTNRTHHLEVAAEQVAMDKWQMGIDVEECLLPLCGHCTGAARDGGQLLSRKTEVEIEDEPLGQSLAPCAQGKGCSEAQLVMAQGVHIKGPQQLAQAEHLNGANRSDLWPLLDNPPGTRHIETIVASPESHIRGFLLKWIAGLLGHDHI